MKMNFHKKLTACLLVAGMAIALGSSTYAAKTAEPEEEPVEEIEIAEEPVDEKTVYVTPGYVVSTPSTAVTDDALLNEKLAEVTLSVRNTIGIGDEYTSFNGNFSDNITSRMWQLYWSNDDNDINVTAAEDGTVVRYYKNYHNSYSNTYGSYNRFFNPKFQKTTRENAKESVKRFMRRVLSETESYALREYDYGTLSTLGVSSFYFNATLIVNGLKTPINLSVTVDSDTLEVTSFSRDDFYDSYFGSYPSASPIYAEKNAFDALSNKFDSTLKYYIVYDESDTEHKYPKAQLQYRFSSTGDWFFDAITGEAVDRNKLYNDAFTRTTSSKASANGVYEEGVMEEPAAMDEAESYTLTQVELDNIEKIKDVLTPEKIAQIVTEKYPEFGLQYFEIASSNYNRNIETDEVTASLYFSKRVTKGAEIGMSEQAFKEREASYNAYYIRKYITVDGKTGELFYYYTSNPYVSEKEYDGKERKIDTKAVGEEFLKKNFPEEFGSSALTSTYTNDNKTSSNYRYTHTVNGYPLECNYLYVSVNAIDGTVETFTRSWVDGVEFESPEGIISADKALEIYTSEYTPKLQYITVPVAIDDKAPEFTPYVKAGWSGYVYSFKTAYTLVSDSRTYAVKAKDGELLKYDETEDRGYPSYTDIDDCKNPEKINTLASYGISYGGTEFEPNKLLTQRDMLVFLLSSMGCNYYYSNNTSDDYTDMIYREAVYYGFIDEGDKNPEKPMKKEDIAKAMVKPSEYGAAATLTGLFKADYNDKDDISKGLAPYLIIAEELGIVSTDGENNINPDKYMTREDLAMALYAFMDR